MGWIQTYTGIAFDFSDMRVESICIEDIAHALSHVNRYTGHTHYAYSVAQHSVLVAMRVKELGGDQSEVLAALLHDATEAYLGDVSSPLKRLLPQYNVIEKQLASLIDEKFNLGGMVKNLTARIKQADLEALASEAEIFFPADKRPRSWGLPCQFVVSICDGVVPMQAKSAEILFLSMYKLLR